MKLPPLEARSTRVRLLAATYEDALTSGTLVDEAGAAPAGRLLLHDDLWTQGSYAEIEHVLPVSSRLFRRLYLGVQFKDQPQHALSELLAVTARMPRDVFVPVLVSMNGGYLEGHARAFAMPINERCRRFGRRAAGSKCCSPGKCWRAEHGQLPR